MRWSLMCLIWCSSFVILYAQNEQKQAEKATKSLSKVYALNESQKEQVRDVYLEYFDNYRSIAAIEHQDFDLFLQKCKHIQLGMEQQMLKVLHPEQRRKYLEFLAARTATLETELDDMRKRGAQKVAIERKTLEHFKPAE